MTIKIEKGIPAPTWGLFTATLRKLKVGESFVHSGKPSTARNTCWNLSKKEKKKFATKLIDKKKNTMRIWRVK